MAPNAEYNGVRQARKYGPPPRPSTPPGGHLLQDPVPPGGARVHINVFQNAEILGKKISQAAYVGFHHILNQDRKDFKAGASVES